MMKGVGKIVLAGMGTSDCCSNFTTLVGVSFQRTLSSPTDEKAGGGKDGCTLKAGGDWPQVTLDRANASEGTFYGGERTGIVE